MAKASMAMKCIDHIPPPIMIARAASHAPAKIKDGVRLEGGDQNGKSDEIRIVRSGNDHQDPPNLDERPVGDASVDAPGSVLQSASRSHRLTEDSSYGMGACRDSLLALPRHPAPARKSRTRPTSSKPQAISTSHPNGKAFAELGAGSTGRRRASVR